MQALMAEEYPELEGKMVPELPDEKFRRDGLPTQTSTKGSTFKGSFHLPRSMILVDKTIGEILAWS